jgi:hypothetical protein
MKKTANRKTMITEIPERFLHNLKELLPRCEYPGAYCLGLLTYLGLTSGHWPPYTVLEVAAQADSVEAAHEVHRTVQAFANGNAKNKNA